MKKISKEYLYTDIYTRLMDITKLCDKYHQIADTQDMDSDETNIELTEKFLKILDITRYLKRTYIDE